MKSNSFDDMFFFLDETLQIDEDNTDVSKSLIECNECVCCTQNDYCVY